MIITQQLVVTLLAVLATIVVAPVSLMVLLSNEATMTRTKALTLTLIVISYAAVAVAQNKLL